MAKHFIISSNDFRDQHQRNNQKTLSKTFKPTLQIRISEIPKKKITNVLLTLVKTKFKCPITTIESKVYLVIELSVKKQPSYKIKINSFLLNLGAEH